MKNVLHVWWAKANWIKCQIEKIDLGWLTWDGYFNFTISQSQWSLTSIHGYQISMDIFQSSVTSIEGHKYALVITDDCTGYRCLYGLKSKDDNLKAIKRWYSNIAELRELHKLIVVMMERTNLAKLLNFLNQKESGATSAPPMNNGKTAKVNHQSIP